MSLDKNIVVQLFRKIKRQFILRKVLFVKFVDIKQSDPNILEFFILINCFLNVLSAFFTLLLEWPRQLHPSPEKVQVNYLSKRCQPTVFLRNRWDNAFDVLSGLPSA
jgi:hypothetical protein